MTQRSMCSTLTAMVLTLAALVGGGAAPGAAQQPAASRVVVADSWTAPLSIGPAAAAPAASFPSRSRGPAPLLLVVVGSGLVGLGLLIRRRQSTGESDNEAA